MLSSLVTHTPLTCHVTSHVCHFQVASAGLSEEEAKARSLTAGAAPALRQPVADVLQCHFIVLFQVASVGLSEDAKAHSLTAGAAPGSAAACY
jgi:hypothetical protein